MATVRSAVLSFAVALVALAGCSSSDDGSTFTVVPDAGPQADLDAGGTFQVGDSADGSAPAALCKPAASSSFTPTWQKPTAFAQGACSTAQIDGFYTACLAPPIDAATCTAFVSANGACATCISSQETDAQGGPVIWHASNRYYTMNIPGCIANMDHDTSATGCGAAYQAVLQCKEAACSTCFASQNGSFSNFSACEAQAGQGSCQKYGTALYNTCDAALHDAGSPIAACIPPSTSTAKDVYDRIAPMFCGK
jgi:hypothetical protein